jgi:2-hydroxycyclohexanecarboxyl-CoA dehydrogenase
MSQPVTIVTGAARGIGSAIANAVAAAGACVAVCDLDHSAAEATAAQISVDHGVPAIGVRVDIASTADVQSAVAHISHELGPITALVNNAGIDVIKPFLDSTEEEWTASSPSTCGHDRLLPGGARQDDRARQEGSSASSDAGRRIIGRAVYSATKGSHRLRRDARPRGRTARHHRQLRVPGPTETALLGQVAEYSQKLYDGLSRAIPLGRTAQPDDIAPAVAFLVSDGAAYITGQTLSVSGGLTMV